MFVASRVESGNEGVLALLPQVTGYIQTAIGCGTLTRANGIAVQVRVDDPVCQGDVIETAADGRIGIRFIDGTVFNLSGDTRVEISEFVASHSALFEVRKGPSLSLPASWPRPAASGSTRLSEAFAPLPMPVASACCRSLP